MFSNLRNLWKHVFSQNISGGCFCLFWNKKSKNEKIKSKETCFLAEVDVKHLCRSLCLACRGETLFKKRVLHRCFPIKLSGDLFPRTPVNSLITLTIKFNFVENISNLVYKAIWKWIWSILVEKIVSLKHFFYKQMEFSKLVCWIWNDGRVCWH